MKKFQLGVLVPAMFIAGALALAVDAGAQTPPPVGAKCPQAAAMTGQQKNSTMRAEHDADMEMRCQCQAMMAKKQEMQAKLQAVDATLNTLVAEMNAAKGSKEPDAMEKPMAAVINELVAQRTASRAMMTEMQSGTMAHMMQHMKMQGTKGSMECPMMKTGEAPEPKPEEKPPKM